jgi:Mrp family chromosome partitioning ATPase
MKLLAEVYDGNQKSIVVRMPWGRGDNLLTIAEAVRLHRELGVAIASAQPLVAADPPAAGDDLPPLCPECGQRHTWRHLLAGG